MINKKSFLGISLIRKRNRRLLVIGYWLSACVVTAVASLLLRNHQTLIGPFAVLSKCRCPVF
jgi:hypothetical protein